MKIGLKLTKVYVSTILETTEESFSLQNIPNLSTKVVVSILVFSFFWTSLKDYIINIKFKFSIHQPTLKVLNIYFEVIWVVPLLQFTMTPNFILSYPTHSCLINVGDTIQLSMRNLVLNASCFFLCLFINFYKSLDTLFCINFMKYIIDSHFHSFYEIHIYFFVHIIRYCRSFNMEKRECKIIKIDVIVIFLNFLSMFLFVCVIFIWFLCRFY